MQSRPPGVADRRWPSLLGAAHVPGENSYFSRFFLVVAAREQG